MQRFSLGPFHIGCALDYFGGAFRAELGHVEGPGFSLDFEGTMTRALEGDLTLRNISADLKNFPLSSFEGATEGQGCVSFTKEELEMDLDLLVKEVVCREFALENEGPLHLHYSTLCGGIVKGLDCRIHKGDFEGYAKIDLLQFDKQQNRWSVQKAKTHLPSEFLHGVPLDLRGQIDCLADFDFATDFSEWSCTIKELFIPIGNELHHLKDTHASSRGPLFFAEGFVQIQNKWGKVGFEMKREGAPRGRLYLEEPDCEVDIPLAIDWIYEKESGLSIQSIEGAFAGLDASFHALESGHLIGSSRLDFRRLSEWIPPAVAKSFQELKMGKGYELKGHLQIDPKNPAQISFQGIFSGKQIELAGFQFRTLLARTDISPTFIRIYDLKISDSAGLVKIDDIRIKDEHPWTIEIPKFAIEELRPSLLVQPGKDLGPISPLVVRQFKMNDFHGLLDDGKTWKASGDLSFINSFKREQTVFDLPANVFGRIIGLDLELLIPVEGALTYELKDGYFNLLELKQTYSEGQRSQFFLVHPEYTSEFGAPRMDLDGNLEILVKMKQFVLFSLTEAFMISIEGKLNDPSFRLQKKKRFL
jgi:hypothetical protein